jgi:hypothetical protein
MISILSIAHRHAILADGETVAKHTEAKIWNQCLTRTREDHQSPNSTLSSSSRFYIRALQRQERRESIRQWEIVALWRFQILYCKSQLSLI